MTPNQQENLWALERLAEMAAKQPDTKPIAGVLNALCGSILLNDTETLLKYCADYTTEKTEILKIMPVGKAEFTRTCPNCQLTLELNTNRYCENCHYEFALQGTVPIQPPIKLEDEVTANLDRLYRFNDSKN